MLPRPPSSTLFPYTTLFRSKLYHLFYTHAVLQTHFKSFSLAHRQAMTRGAMSNIADKPAGYDFGKTFNDLEAARSEEHTSELQSRFDLVCRLLLEKKKHILI